MYCELLYIMVLHAMLPKEDGIFGTKKLMSILMVALSFYSIKAH